MGADTPLDITGLLQRWSNGEQAALAELTSLVYEELRRLARGRLARERPGQTLNTTGLVHEAWLRLVTVKDLHWQHRSQFFGLCAQLMRHILVDHARRRLRACRGGGAERVPLQEGLLVSEERSPSLVALDDALNALSALDPRKGRVVELRFFGGLTTEEAAEILQISPENVKRDWRVARLWLTRELNRSATDGG
ncbi:MAG: sigma-70 family RNA polymerase sigma factor [Bryobacterales bacterium]|nr:sigma-70 family RNA polymerase sigma factor [Bryobacterales bacterium]